ncbi:unnamed protein product [Candida verbasci]|uniref:Large ribosomal subunit protein mL50 n=1 Tax=Candida verbasci TaxID=1227364 RepID=A0A9W4XFX4_9ASCO|nr:unnamed protein product [Candida verbasci]
MIGIIPKRTIITSTRSLSWFGDIFGGSKNLKQRQEKIEATQKEDLNLSESIEILNYQNSKEYLESIKNKKRIDYKIKNWKILNLKPYQIESYYESKEKLQNIINEQYKALTNQDIKYDSYETINLDDLQFRFDFIKSLESNLGFEINDYTISKSHNLKDLYIEIENQVSLRWKNERNPNSIVLRPDDFTAPNIYLNLERDDKQKQAEYNKLIAKMKQDQKNQQIQQNQL